MSVLDVLNAPWAIAPARFEEIQAIYAAHARGERAERADLVALEARMGRPLANEQRRYEVRDGVAVVPLEGVMAKKMNLLSAISGGSSSQMVAADLMEAANDDRAHSIILAIDSPGGTVDGTIELAQAVKAAGKKKPLATLASGAMASAAYWAGSAAGAGRVFIADGTTQVGSIGVVAKHVDVSGAEAQQGIKTTEISAGKFKRSASQYAPLSDAGRATIQDQVDYVYSLFIESVAENRGIDEEKVVQDMADGRTFHGKQAIAAGLVDGISTMPALIQQLNDERAASKSRRTTSHQAATGATMPQTIDQILAESPEAAQHLIARGAEQERARIQGVENACLPGHESLIANFKFDGKTSPGDAALAVMSAERRSRQTAAEQLAADAPAVVRAPATPANDARADTTKAEQAAQATTLSAKEGISFVEAFKKLGYEYA